MMQGMKDHSRMPVRSKEERNWGAWTPPEETKMTGLLQFRALDPQPASVQLQIRLTGDSAPRTFKWQLK
jgi:hypothetical protein